MSAEMIFVWVDHIKNLEKVICHGQRTAQGKGLLESPGYVICKREGEWIIGSPTNRVR